MIEYRTQDQIEADAKEDALMAARSAFRNYANAISPEGENSEWAQDAWANAFSVETYAEYADDTQRWDVALSTLKMYVDQA